ncbi:protein of unknown function [Bradyrhizobium vignae]|uniref:Uncharacterized protein n=1 Tax=Bradyrhizobium vignae TaxID=1549949 RepID=A0A2U3Q925_9BRAD|nr:protein of unknown function [Bradyrhizobium vignae]
MIVHGSSFTAPGSSGWAAAFAVNSQSLDYYSKPPHYSCGPQGKMHFWSAIIPLLGGYRRERTNIKICEPFARQYVVCDRCPDKAAPPPKARDVSRFIIAIYRFG